MPVVLEHARGGGEPAGRGEDLVGPGLGEAQVGEGVVHALGLAERGELLVDQALADGLREGREPGLAAQRDQRQPGRLALLDDGVGQLLPTAAELDHQPDGVGLREAAHEPCEGGGVVRQGDAGREEQVAPAQQRSDVGELGGVHPPDGAGEPAVAGEHDRVGRAHGRHLQDVGDAQHEGATVSELIRLT